MRMARVAGMLAAEAQPEFPQMTLPSESWDYFVVTASNDAQAATYESQLALRREFGMLAGVRNVLVVADPGGKRVGSGGSTICCLAEIAARELAARPAGATGPAAWESIFRRLRILILHAGGDSRRLPAYGSCGKLFIPVPDESDGALPNQVADAMAQKDLPAFGGLVDAAWRLNKQLDPKSTTPEIEELLTGLQGHLWGAKLLGAGGGGFLLLVCKSPQDATAVRRRLNATPPNALARFFDFTISPTGLAVTVS